MRENTDERNKNSNHWLESQKKNIIEAVEKNIMFEA